MQDQDLDLDDGDSGPNEIGARNSQQDPLNRPRAASGKRPTSTQPQQQINQKTLEQQQAAFAKQQQMEGKSLSTLAEESDDTDVTEIEDGESDEEHASGNQSDEDVSVALIVYNT